jgi:MoaD family protein
VDEIGQLELEGKGLWPALKEALFDEQRSALLVIRRNLVAEYGRIFDPIPVKIFEENERADLAKSIIKMNEISVKVKFFAYFREIFGLKERDLVFFRSVTLRQLLNALCDTPAQRAEVFASDQLKPHLVVMVNGASPPAATGLDSKIKDGDVVSIFPLMGGG